MLVSSYFHILPDDRYGRDPHRAPKEQSVSNAAAVLNSQAKGPCQDGTLESLADTEGANPLG
jgi:hypothetical protein